MKNLNRQIVFLIFVILFTVTTSDVYSIPIKLTAELSTDGYNSLPDVNGHPAENMIESLKKWENMKQ